MKDNDSIRKLDEPEGSPNQYAKINHIYDDNSVWVTNLNMPFMGNISKIYSQKEFEVTFEIVEK